MTLALTPSLAERPEPTRRFLRAAVALESPTVAALVGAGVPRWDADEFVRRLELAGELGGGTWAREARASYEALLAAAPGTKPERALARLPDGERPREKALRAGIDALDDTELVALLLRTGGGDEGVLEL